MSVFVNYLHRLEMLWDGLWQRWRGLSKRPTHLLSYMGYGDGQRLRMRLRVVVEGRLAPGPAGGKPNLFNNLKQMLHRFQTDEVPKAEVRAEIAGRHKTVCTDEEGYAEIAWDDLPPAAGNREVRLTLIDAPGNLSEGETVRAEALVVSAQARFGVISDIDDTVLVTGAANIWRNLYTSLTNTAESRLAFPGIATFYQMLQGDGARGSNPIFYVSSSPYNLYDLLDRFMEIRGIPKGPMFLRDLGLDASGFTLKGGHKRHKVDAIETLLDFYPQLRFILIGDSGQHDAEIYADIVRRYPSRILAVYLRDVVGDDVKTAAKRILLEEVEATGIGTVFCPDLAAAAEHAAGEGWITRDAVLRVRAEVAEETGAR